MCDSSAILTFLRKVDLQFPVPLSSKQDLEAYAKKLCERATLCIELENGEIVAMVAGYTQQVVENTAYIALVATLPEAQGKGIASRLVRQFIGCAAKKGLSAVHLYAVPTNFAAMKLYKKLGFVSLVWPHDPRPEDAHLIYYIQKEC